MHRGPTKLYLNVYSAAMIQYTWGGESIGHLSNACDKI